MADRDPADQLGAIQEKLAEISGRIGLQGPRPDDPDQARRWDTPLFGRLSELGESLHALRNFAHVLNGLTEQLGRKLDRNAEISLGNREEILQLAETSRKIEASASRIEVFANRLIGSKPLLMRNIKNADTTMTEITLFVILALEGMVFAIGSETLTNSALFAVFRYWCAIPQVWGMLCFLMSLAGVISFANRQETFRTWVAFAICLYFSISGVALLIGAGGAMGWVSQLTFGMLSLWIVVRGPSGAVR